MKNINKLLLIIPAIFVGLFAFGGQHYAYASSTTLRIDSETIIKGYTVTHDNDGVRFAVTPGQVDQEVNVTLKDRSLEGDPLPEGKKVVSKIYSYDMIGREYNPIITTRPSWLAIKYNSSDEAKKAIHHWDSNKNTWVELPSSIDAENKYLRAITHLPYSKVAILEDAAPQEEYSGIASWYYAEPMSAAMNQFNIGDKVKVINPANNKSCVVTIKDRGPFVPGRIIDLSSDAFAMLAPLSEGLISVKVISY